MASRPFDSRIQDLVYNIEVGIGLQVIKAFLYILFMLAVAILYMATEYAGFNSKEAMDYAQLARRFSAEGKLNTNFVRPLSIWQLMDKKKIDVTRPNLEHHPDIINAPLYPMVLGTTFKLTNTKFPRPDKEKYEPEQWVIVPLNYAFSFLAALLLYLTGRQLFDKRVALTGTTIFFVSKTVWADALGGTERSLSLFLASLAVWCGVKLVTNRAKPDARWWSWLPHFLVGMGACVALFLTRYAAVAFIPGFLLFLTLCMQRRRWLVLLAGLLLFTAGIAPWIVRNQKVSGSPFGITPYTALADQHDSFERSLAPDLDNTDLYKGVSTRFINHFPQLLTLETHTMGNGILFCLFVTTFFYRFQRRSTHILRWGLALSYLVLVLISSVFGVDTMAVSHIFYPLVVLYGTAFFFILLDRMQISVRIVSLTFTTLFVLLQGLSMLFTILPPRPGNNYPPYLPGHIHFFASGFKPEEMVCTDMPWATAWYGNRLSLYLPGSLKEFEEVNDFMKRVRGLYFSPLTRDKRYVSDLLRGSYKTWYPITEFRLTADFPLKFGFPMMNGEVVILADENRWAR